MITFCNLVCVYVHKIREVKFYGCTKSFSWLGKNVNRRNDAYGQDSDTDLCPWQDAASRQDILTPFSILIEFEATEYLYSIRYIFEDIRFE